MDMELLADTGRAEIDKRLREWGAWMRGERQAGGYPSRNVLHPGWVPPGKGSIVQRAPVVACSDDARARATHAVIVTLSHKLQAALHLVYVVRMGAGEAAAACACQVGTLRARVLLARRALARAYAS